jgi:hypothetical protein
VYDARPCRAYVKDESCHRREKPHRQPSMYARGAPWLAAAGGEQRNRRWRTQQPREGKGETGRSSSMIPLQQGRQLPAAASDEPATVPSKNEGAICKTIYPNKGSYAYIWITKNNHDSNYGVICIYLDRRIITIQIRGFCEINIWVCIAEPNRDPN